MNNEQAFKSLLKFEHEKTISKRNKVSNEQTIKRNHKFNPIWPFCISLAQSPKWQSNVLIMNYLNNELTKISQIKFNTLKLCETIREKYPHYPKKRKLNKRKINKKKNSELNSSL